jgi:dolichol-phosphate mannosyltransferase
MVLPCFNQSAGLASIVDGWVRALKKLDQPFEMIIVVDGSTDGSAETADGIAAREINVSVIRHGERRGYGAAIRTGLAASKHPLFLYSRNCFSQSIRPTSFPAAARTRCRAH